MDVDAGWEKAVEAVLGPLAQALTLAPGEYGPERLDGAPAGIALVDTPAEVSGDAGSLAWRVRQAGGAASVLASVYEAATLEEAMARREQLADHQSLVTPEGAWIGRHWVRLPAEHHDDTGMIERQKRIEALEGESGSLQETVSRIDDELHGLREARDESETRLAEARTELSNARDAFSAAESRLGALRARMEQVRGTGESYSRGSG